MKIRKRYPSRNYEDKKSVSKRKGEATRQNIPYKIKKRVSLPKFLID
jgi:hypothetical protein